MADSICSNCEISYTHEPGDKIRHLCVNCAECDGCGAGVSIWFSAWHDDVMLCDGCNVSFKGGNARLVRIVAPSGTKLTQAQIEDLDGTTARRAALLNEIETMQSAHSDELDAAIVAFHTADEAGDHEAAGPLWRAMNALVPNRKYSTYQRWETLKA